jgi:hypothetical protein
MRRKGWLETTVGNLHKSARVRLLSSSALCHALLILIQVAWTGEKGPLWGERRRQIKVTLRLNITAAWDL